MTVRDRTALAVKHHKSRAVALLTGMLGDQSLGQIVIKVGCFQIGRFLIVDDGHKSPFDDFNNIVDLCKKITQKILTDKKRYAIIIAKKHIIMIEVHRITARCQGRRDRYKATRRGYFAEGTALAAALCTGWAVNSRRTVITQMMESYLLIGT